MPNTQTADRQRTHPAAATPSSAWRFAARNRLIHDWATRVLREEERDEVLAMLAWLAVHGDRHYLGALALVAYRFPGDVAVTAVTAAAIARIEAR